MVPTTARRTTDRREKALGENIIVTDEGEYKRAVRKERGEWLVAFRLRYEWR